MIAAAVPILGAVEDAQLGGEIATPEEARELVRQRWATACNFRPFS